MTAACESSNRFRVGRQAGYACRLDGAGINRHIEIGSDQDLPVSQTQVIQGNKRTHGYPQDNALQYKTYSNRDVYR